MVLTVSLDRSAWLWDAATGKELARLTHEDNINASDFSPDGAKIVTASGSAARLWDAAGGRELARLAHENWVSAAAFSPDGGRIVTASGDPFGGKGEARLWDAATGKELARIAHENGVRAAAASLDASAGHVRIVTVSGGDAFLWQIESTTDRLVQTAKRRVPRCLTREQRAQYFLPPAPPVWCITGPGLEAEMDSAKWQPKWPYQSAAWRDWLVARQRGESPPVPASE
jgi:WD40 repeat protein